MATPQDVIDAALRKIGALDANGTATGAEVVDALATFNQMLHAWQLEGIKLGHTELELAETIPHPEDHTRAMVFNLAAELATEYGRPLTPDLYTEAQRSRQVLRRAYTSPPKMRTAPGLHPYYNPRGLDDG